MICNIHLAESLMKTAAMNTLLGMGTVFCVLILIMLLISAFKLLSIFEKKPEKDEKTGRMNMVPVEGSEKEVKAELVLIAAGFLGSESYVTEGFGVEVDGRTNVKTDAGSYAAKVKENGKESAASKKTKIYTAGDMHRGQSLVVWAISEGRKAAREVDLDLMGFTNL